MQCRNTTQSYGAISRNLHKIIAILVILMLIGGSLMGYIDNKQLAGVVYTAHKSIGIVIFGLALLFVLWSIIGVKPGYSEQMLRGERALARGAHFLLFVFMLAMPAAGWIMSTAYGKAPDFFWLIKFPMPGIPEFKPLAMTARHLHDTIAWYLAGVIVLHTLGALKHHFIDKNDILTRMMRGK